MTDYGLVFPSEASEAEWRCPLGCVVFDTCEEGTSNGLTRMKKRQLDGDEASCLHLCICDFFPDSGVGSEKGTLVVAYYEEANENVNVKRIVCAWASVGENQRV